MESPPAADLVGQSGQIESFSASEELPTQLPDSDTAYSCSVQKCVGAGEGDKVYVYRLCKKNKKKKKEVN